MSRASGVLMHISSLPGEYSIGSFGKEAIEFIDFLADRNSLQLVYSPALPVLPCTSQPHVHSLAEGRNLN